jgi:hypothetical protein
MRRLSGPKANLFCSGNRLVTMPFWQRVTVKERAEPEALATVSRWPRSSSRGGLTGPISLLLAAGGLRCAVQGARRVRAAAHLPEPQPDCQSGQYRRAAPKAAR